MRYEIRALDIGGVLDQTLRLFRDHFLFLAVVAGCLLLLPQLVVSMVSATMMTALMAAEYAEADEYRASVGVALIMASALGGFITWVLGFIVQGAICYGIAWRYLGYEVPAGACLRATMNRALPLFGMALLMVICETVGFAFCIIPGVLLFLMWYVAVPTFMFEGEGVLKSLSRGSRLMRGEMGKAFVVAFLLFVIGLAVGGMTAFIPNPFVTAVLTSVANTVLMALNAVAVTVFYFSARCIHENFDLELMAQAMERRAEPAEASTL